MCVCVWAAEPQRPSVDGEADRAVHLLADEPRGPWVGLYRGAGEDPVCREDLLLCGGPGLLGLLQLPDEKITIAGQQVGQKSRICLHFRYFCLIIHVKYL